MITFDSGMDARCRSVAVPTVARFRVKPGEWAYCVIGTPYGYWHTTGGDVRTWKTASGARKGNQALHPTLNRADNEPSNNVFRGLTPELNRPTMRSMKTKRADKPSHLSVQDAEWLGLRRGYYLVKNGERHFVSETVSEPAHGSEIPMATLCFAW